MLAFAVRTGLTIAVCSVLTSLAGAESPSGAPAHWPMPVMDNHPYSLVLVDRLEYGNSDDGDNLLWDVQGWYGGDYNKLWVKSEGEGLTGESLEVIVSLGDVPEQGLGTGLTSTEAGLRLRYEFRREIAPYIGVRWETLHGGTRDIARAAGESSSTSLVLGIRAWF